MNPPPLVRPRAGEPPAAEPAGPVAITVHHHPELLPGITFDGPRQRPVEVAINGDLQVHWGNEASWELVFCLSDQSPEARIDGFQLTWAGEQAPPPDDFPLRFGVASGADADGHRRTLRVTLYPCREVLTYSLLLSENGTRYRIDPKIYNQGDGDGGPGGGGPHPSR